MPRTRSGKWTTIHTVFFIGEFYIETNGTIRNTPLSYAEDMKFPILFALMLSRGFMIDNAFYSNNDRNFIILEMRVVFLFFSIILLVPNGNLTNRKNLTSFTSLYPLCSDSSVTFVINHAQDSQGNCPQRVFEKVTFSNHFNTYEFQFVFFQNLLTWAILFVFYWKRKSKYMLWTWLLSL